MVIVGYSFYLLFGSNFQKGYKITFSLQKGRGRLQKGSKKGLSLLHLARFVNK